MLRSETSRVEAKNARYKKKSAGGPTALIQKLSNELKMEMQKNEMEEKNAQEDYEELMAESAEKRAADSKTITEKESQKVRVKKKIKMQKIGQYP